MSKAWAYMHSQGVETLRGNNVSSSEKIQKASNLVANLTDFERNVVETHNSRRLKIFRLFDKLFQFESVCGIHLTYKIISPTAFFSYFPVDN